MNDLHNKQQWLRLLRRPNGANTHERALIEAIKTARGAGQVLQIRLAYPNLAAAYTEYLTQTLMGRRNHVPIS